MQNKNLHQTLISFKDIIKKQGLLLKEEHLDQEDKLR